MAELKRFVRVPDPVVEAAPEQKPKQGGGHIFMREVWSLVILIVGIGIGIFVDQISLQHGATIGMRAQMQAAAVLNAIQGQK